MKPILLIGMVFSLLNCTKLTAQSDQLTKIRAIQAVNIWPFSINDESNDTLVYFFRNDTVILRTSYTSRHVFFSADQEEAESSIVSKVYRYFIFKKGATKGQWWEDYRMSPNKFNDTELVDLVLARKQGYFTTPLAELIQNDSMQLINSKTIDQQIEKTYIFNKHRHPKGADTLILGFHPGFKQTDFLFYNYQPAEENMALNSVQMIVQCDEAIQKNMPEFAVMKFLHYLSEVSPAAIAEAEKYFALFRSTGGISARQ